MIDLERASLPSTLVGPGGEGAAVVTGFRAWLRFRRLLSEDRVLWLGIFPGGQPPEWPWVDPALEFLRSDNETPRRTGPRTGPRTVDVFRDGDYVVAAFQQAYGLDLTDPGLDLHWHRFLALLRGLPAGTKLSEIAGWRGWDERQARRRPDEVRGELRDMWRLPEDRADDAGVLEWQQRVFGGITYDGGGA